MKFYGYWRSSSAWRVRIALAYKNVAHEYQPVHLLRDGGEQHKGDYKAKNPMAQVPLIEFEEGGVVRRIAQSLAIIEYLDERFPEPPLLPKDGYLRAKARQLAETINAGIQPFQNTSTQRYVKHELKVDEKAWTRHWIAAGLAGLEALTAEVAGRYSVGDAVSIADACLVPQLYAARRFDLDLAPFPTLLRVEAACAELPAFQAAHADRQPDAAPVTP